MYRKGGYQVVGFEAQNVALLTVVRSSQLVE